MLPSENLEASEKLHFSEDFTPGKTKYILDNIRPLAVTHTRIKDIKKEKKKKKKRLGNTFPKVMKVQHSDLVIIFSEAVVEHAQNSAQSNASPNWDGFDS